MKSKIGKITITIMLILAMTLSNLIFIGQAIASSILEATNDSNVEFGAYFKGDSENIQKELEITSNDLEANLYFDINIKNGGYFNGIIEIENSNFTFKESSSEYVKTVESNKIYLNQINAGEDVEIPVVVKLQKDELYDLSLLNKETNIKIEGTYKNSEQKDSSIKATRTVTLKVVSGDANLETSVDVLTNKVLKVAGEEKRVIQIAVDNVFNSYPVKEFNIEILTPVVDEKLPEILTNAQFNNMTDMHSESSDTKTTIKLTNNSSNENKVIWKNDGKDRVVITYLYDKNTEIGELQFTPKVEAILYDNSKLVQQDKSAVVSEEKESIVTVDSVSTEKEIYKGKLYNKTERSIKTNTKVNLNLANVIEDVSITEEKPSFANEDGEKFDTNVYYRETVLSKADLINLLGDNGTLDIYDISDDKIILLEQITSDSEADENGNIVINYPSDVTKVQYEINKVQKEGTLNILSTKVFVDNGRDIVKGSTNIINSVTGSYSLEEDTEIRKLEDAVNVIKLKDTQTKALLQINKNKLSTVAKNENIEIRAILKSDSEEYDLYKNPKLEIILPIEVQELEINSVNLMYAQEEIKISKVEKGLNDEGKKVINIQLEGEQTEYLGNISQGIQVIINADIVMAKNISSQDVQLEMKYTNENGSEEQYETNLPIKVTSKYGLILYKAISDFNNENEKIDTISANLNGTLDTDNEEKDANTTLELINNYDSEINNIEVTVNLNQEINKEEIIASINKDVNVSNDNVEVYYDEQQDNVQSYKLVLKEPLQVGEKCTIDYDLNIPGSMLNNEEIIQDIKTNYTYMNQKMTDDSKIILSTSQDLSSEEEIEKVNSLEETIDGIGNVKITTISGNKELEEGQEIYEGQSVKYIVEITNETENTINNLTMKAEMQNANVYDYEEGEFLDSRDMDNMIKYTRLKEMEGQTEITREVGTLEPGETKTIDYQVAALDSGVLTGDIKLYTEEKEYETIKTISNNIVNGDLKISMSNNSIEEVILTNEDRFSVNMKMKNLTQSKLENATAYISIPEEVNVEEIITDKEGITLNGNNLNIESIDAGETIDITLWLKVKGQEEVTKNTNITLYYLVSQNDNIYTSNQIYKKVEVDKTKIQIQQEVSVNPEEMIQTGDELVYTFNITNEAQEPVEIIFRDYVPSAATIQRAYYEIDGETHTIELSEENKILIEKLNVSGSLKVVIETLIDEQKSALSKITNTGEVEYTNGIIKSNQVTHTLKNIYQEEKKKEELEKEIAKNSISGTVWVDANANGQRDDNENTVQGVDVELLSTTGESTQNEHEIDMMMTTDEDGKYIFENIPDGEYIVVIYYDNSKYELTQYKKDSVEESINSDVVEKEMYDTVVAITDIIEVNGSNYTNIDAGLIERGKFDLHTEKYITKIIAQNDLGTGVNEYKDTHIAKVEIPAKYMLNTTVIVEYSIKITNEGEIAGYANDIVDYMPNDLTFSSELNKTWYVGTDGQLHNTSLSNEIINPGETKELTLTLTKVMTNNNIGTSNNIAEIAKDYNDLGIQDIDSTAGNKQQDEDDMSMAQVIISIQTGSEVTIGIFILIVIIIGVLIITRIYYKKRKEV